LRQDDVTWEEIAQTLRVARQSAHRRLSKKITKLTDAVYSKAIHHESGRAVVLQYNANVDAIRNLAKGLRHLDVPTRRKDDLGGS
jgi:hypothetical protein